jgi:LPXTG-site transpeptidase (sortase) family protein
MKKILSITILAVLVLVNVSIAFAALGTTPVVPTELATGSATREFHSQMFLINGDLFFIDDGYPNSSFYSVASDGTETKLNLSGDVVGTTVSEVKPFNLVTTNSSLYFAASYGANVYIYQLVPTSTSTAQVTRIHTFTNVYDNNGALKSGGSNNLIFSFQTNNIAPDNQNVAYLIDLSSAPASVSEITRTAYLNETVGAAGFMAVSDAAVCNGKTYLGTQYYAGDGSGNYISSVWVNNSPTSNTRVFGTTLGQYIGSFMVNGNSLYTLSADFSGGDGEIVRIDCTTDAATTIFAAQSAGFTVVTYYPFQYGLAMIDGNLLFAGVAPNGVNNNRQQVYGISSEAMADLTSGTTTGVALADVAGETAFATGGTNYQGHEPWLMVNDGSRIIYGGRSVDGTYNIFALELGAATPTATPTQPGGGSGGGGEGSTTDAMKSNLLPSTGFSQRGVSSVALQPESLAYTSYSDLSLSIPSINVALPIVGVPQVNNRWDVSWLGENAGYLHGTAFPTWLGNSVITGHVWNADNQPGAFAELKKVAVGDQVIVKGFGQTAVYKVTDSRLVWPTQTNVVMASYKDQSVITLLTCEDYSILWDTYSFRRMVRAELVEIK